MTDAEFKEYMVRKAAAEAALEPYSLKKIKAAIRSFSDGWSYFGEDKRYDVINKLLDTSGGWSQTLAEVMAVLEGE